MFDQQQPEDMFSSTEPVKTQPEGIKPPSAPAPIKVGGPLPTHTSPAPMPAPAYQVTPEDLGEEVPSGGNKKLFYIIVAVVGILVLGGGGYLAWAQFFSKPTSKILQENPKITNTTTETPAAENTGLTNAATETPAKTVTPAQVDTDMDGLLDDEELDLGTNPMKMDTDDDELTDREETKIYKTDPLNPDTDGDTYLDGKEVKAGYNPNGAGKLPGLSELPVAPVTQP